MASEVEIAVEPLADSGFGTQAAPWRRPVEIGMFVKYGERLHAVVGITPMSVTPRLVELEDADGRRIRRVQPTDPHLEIPSG
jgi:hypothetical protein